MKIAIVLPDLKFGGAEKLHINLAEEWRSNGHEVHFILMNKRGEFLSMVPNNVYIKSLNVNRLREVVFPLKSYLKEYRPDITLAAMWPLTSIAVVSWILSGKVGKIFLSDHVHLSSSIANEINTHMFYIQSTILLTYRLVNGVIAVSEGVKDNLIKIGRFKKNKIKVIYNPIVKSNNCLYSANHDRRKMWEGDFKYNILSVAELKAQKDHKTLIKAISLLPKELDFRLVILGDGKLMEELRLLVKSLKLNDKVMLRGYVSNPYPWYCTADLFVLSSMWEGFGNVIVEALECGVPVVSTNCPSGPSEILDNGEYGTLVPVGDYVLLSNAIHSTLLKKVNKNKLIERSKQFTVTKISLQYLKYFEEIF